MKQFTLAAFSAERRVVAFAFFDGIHLQHTHVRRLLADPNKSVGSVREMVSQTLERHKPEFVAVACPSDKAGGRVRGFCEIVRDTARSIGIPLVDVADSTLMTAYGHPPLKRKEHLRQVGRTIWPSLNDPKSKSAAVDAAVTGLHVQTERLFSFHEEAV